MSLPVVLRPEAIRDAEQTRDYLEMQRGELGQAFLDRLHESEKRVGNRIEPKLGRTLFFPFRLEEVHGRYQTPPLQ